MIRYLLHHEINRAKWDRCIEQSFNGNVYAYTWYLDRVHPYWEALVENDYERVMVLTGNKKWGVHYLFQPYFTQQLGVFSIKILTSKKIIEFIENIPSKYKSCEIQLNIHNHPDIQPPYKLTSQKNYLLDLIDNYTKLYKHYSYNTKRNLTKSGKYKLSISKNIKPERIVQLFRENRGKSLSKWKDRHYLRLQSLMYMAQYKGKGISYGVFTEQNELCAAAFFLVSHYHIIFLFSGTNDFAKESGAMTFLLDSVIKEFSETQYILDFEGSNDPGLARFYRGFGAKEVLYYKMEYNKLSFPLRQMVHFKNYVKSEI